MRFLILPALALTAACSKAPEVSKEERAPAIERTVEALRLYVIDCGRIEVANMGIFDRGGAYEGQTRSMVDSCYLVRHPQGDLMWDAGMPDAIAEAPEGVTDGVFKITVPKTLQGQLERIGAPPAAIEFFSISHSHFDHVGNANLFKDATFIVHEREREHMFRPDARKDAQAFSGYSELEAAKKVSFTDSYDVFGDGKVIIIAMPGHTPGHSVLLVNLQHSGPILLTGDLYHLSTAREKRTVPTFNTDAEQTLVSMDKFEQLANDSGARVIIQHETADFENLPRAPAYLD
ncbi:MAG: N-acyl homoserine lactonase family protein [Parvularculaceae bacterium]|nr:N-acyl homoserine lactonase family protein [Parvularculaceae bacterium]